MDKSSTLPLTVVVFALVGTMIELEPIHADTPGLRVATLAQEPEVVPLPEAMKPEERKPVPMTPERKKEEAAKPEVALTPGDIKTPEEAAKRAADPRAPTGALIIAPGLKK